MCGICGIWLSPTSSRQLSGTVVERMTAAIAHRGPDAGAQTIDGRVAFGHRRLSIIDLANGAQPMLSSDGGCRLTYNGEIYNFLELRAELEALGRRFRTRCDTEVIVEGYSEWGEDLFQRLSGMYAFALHDLDRDRLYLVRDRLGIKPLYYTWSGPDLVFGSEVRSILESGLVQVEVDAELIDPYLTLGYVPGARTLFAGIEKLLPAHFMAIDASGVRLERYWDLANVEPMELDYEEAKQRFTELFATTLERHLISDVPLGAFLSGGVDSSAVVAFVREELGRPLATYSVGYRDDPRSSELGHAGQVAARFGTEHHEFYLTHEDFFAGIEDLLAHAEEPIVESAAVALLGLSKFASRHATVFLSGEGADEAFAGYDLYGRSLKLDRLHRLAGGRAPRLVRALVGPLARNERLDKYLDWTASPLAQRYRSIPADITPSIRRRMQGGDGRGGADPLFQALFAEVAHRDPLAQMQYVDIKTWLVDDLLLKADKMTMAASIELRVPFLDHRMVELGLALPPAVKHRNGVGKALLKDTLARYLPKSLIHRPKQGFPVPISKWLREDLYAPARAILLDERTLDRGYVRRGYVERCLTEHRAGKADFGRRLFSLLVLELWHRKYVEGDAPAYAAAGGPPPALRMVETPVPS